MSELTVAGAAVPLRVSPNSSMRPAGVGPSVVVLHSTGGSFAGALSWLRDPASRVSAHFLVSRGGMTVQLVPLARAAWHAGASSWRGRTGVNAFSLGIEMEHVDGAQDWPDAQVHAVAALCRTLLSRYGLTPADITGHADVAVPRGRKVDPRDFPWPTLRASLGGPAPRPLPTLSLAGARIPGRIIQQTLYVPARAVCEALGIEGRWDPARQELLAEETVRAQRPGE